MWDVDGFSVFHIRYSNYNYLIIYLLNNTLYIYWCSRTFICSITRSITIFHSRWNLEVECNWNLSDFQWEVRGGLVHTWKVGRITPGQNCILKNFTSIFFSYNNWSICVVVQKFQFSSVPRTFFLCLFFITFSSPVFIYFFLTVLFSFPQPFHIDTRSFWNVQPQGSNERET